MLQNLHLIQKKIDDIGLGLLRSRESQLLSVPITARCDQDNLIQCYTNEIDDLVQLRYKMVSLVQKSREDYLYVAGQAEPVPGNGKALAVRIFKACWFVRKRKGSITWFQEKHIYHMR